MNEQVACSIAVVCEADADRRAATLLSDRVLCETIEWKRSLDASCRTSLVLYGRRKLLGAFPERRA